MYFLVPRDVLADKITLWLAAVEEPGGPGSLNVEPHSIGVQVTGPSEMWPTGGPHDARVHYREIEISGLRPRTDYSFTLQANGANVASAKVRTLPAVMPLLGEKPFTVLLGSCFAHQEDSECKLGNTFFHMPRSAAPDIKILAGDQVYLDSPWYRFMMPHSSQELQDVFLEHYVRTWSQDGGFANLLVDGANYFCSDDHEFWNNAPNRGAYVTNTWEPSSRRFWMQAATELYSTFQTPKAISRFSIAPVSFLLADTRINRDAERENFMKGSDLDKVEQWIENLEGPGVLILGQPLLQTKTGFLKGHFGDWNLPDFKQYHRLAKIVGASRQTLVILTGDVHFGRIARSTLRSGRELVELISSPMSLIDEKARGNWAKAPVRFPSISPDLSTSAWLARSEVITDPEFAPTDSHFLTLEFTRRGPGAHLNVRFWPIFKGGVPPPEFGKSVWTRVLL